MPQSVYKMKNVLTTTTLAKWQCILFLSVRPWWFKSHLQLPREPNLCHLPGCSPWLCKWCIHFLSVWVLVWDAKIILRLETSHSTPSRSGFCLETRESQPYLEFWFSFLDLRCPLSRDLVVLIQLAFKVLTNCHGIWLFHAKCHIPCWVLA